MFKKSDNNDPISFFRARLVLIFDTKEIDERGQQFDELAPALRAHIGHIPRYWSVSDLQREYFTKMVQRSAITKSGLMVLSLDEHMPQSIQKSVRDLLEGMQERFSGNKLLVNNAGVDAIHCRYAIAGDYDHVHKSIQQILTTPRSNSSSPKNTG